MKWLTKLFIFIGYLLMVSARIVKDADLLKPQDDLVRTNETDLLPIEPVDDLRPDEPDDLLPVKPEEVQTNETDLLPEPASVKPELDLKVPDKEQDTKTALRKDFTSSAQRSALLSLFALRYAMLYL